jgi:YD repeat-containing protein
MKHVVIYWGIMLVVGAGLVSRSLAVLPNYVQTEVHVNPDSAPSISVSYSGGLGRNLQTSVYLDVNKTRVYGTVFDDAGRQWRTTVPFIHPTLDFIPDPVLAAQGNRGDAYPYHESRYKPDTYERIDAMGAPGADFSLSGGNCSRNWYLGTILEKTNLSNIDQWGFIKNDPALLNEIALNGLEASGVTETFDATHFLTVTKGPNDNSYSQEIKDKFGRTVSRCEMLNIRSENTYDVLGNLLQQSPPDNTTPRNVNVQKATIVHYNTIGQAIETTTPDAGLVEYLYDASGQLIASQDAKQRTAGENCYTVYLYDALGRDTAIGVNKSLNTEMSFHQIDPDNPQWTVDGLDLRIRKIYDDPANLVAILGASYTPEYFSSNYCPLEKTQGRVVAEIAYLENSSSSLFLNKITIDIFTYDDEGKVTAQLKRVPKMNGFYMFSYTYDQQGNLIAYRYAKNEQGNNPTMDNLLYQLDRHGRIITINSIDANNNTSAVVDNEYSDIDLLNKKVFGYSTDRSSNSDFIQYYYNLRNWPTGNSNSKFMEMNLCYNTSSIGGTTLLQPQYNGNISAVQYRYNVPGSYEFGIEQYEYDRVERLTKVNSDNALFSADQEFTYNADGTLNTKLRSNVPTNAKTFTGTYRYVPNSNKVHTIEGHASKGNVNNFVYDPNGNMIFDYSKKMYVDYDWRNLPISFKFYNSISSDLLITDNETARANLWRTLKQAIEAASGTTMVSEVKMVYDASGNRVVKKEYNY